MMVSNLCSSTGIGNMNKAAQALGRLARGVRKQFSEEELARRTERIRAAGKLRWAKEIGGRPRKKKPPE